MPMGYGIGFTTEKNDVKTPRIFHQVHIFSPGQPRSWDLSSKARIRLSSSCEMVVETCGTSLSDSHNTNLHRSTLIYATN